MTQASPSPHKDAGAGFPRNAAARTRGGDSLGIVLTLLTIWVLYATVRAKMGHFFCVTGLPYLTPFYSPCVSGECVPGCGSLGVWFPALPPIIPYAIVSLVFVLGFRLTCYSFQHT